MVQTSVDPVMASSVFITLYELCSIFWGGRVVGFSFCFVLFGIAVFLLKRALFHLVSSMSFVPPTLLLAEEKIFLNI